MRERVSFKEINRLAIPAIFAGIIEPIISITDMAVAGRLTHDTALALAAIGLVGGFLSTLIWVFAQTRSAISSFVSQALGANRLNEIRPLVGQIFWMNGLISAFILFSTCWGASFIFELYRAEGSVLSYAVEYYQIRAWGFPFTLLTFTIFGAFRGLQNTSWAMKISLVGGIVNVVLDWFFAYYLDLHVAGIAYASLIAQAIMFLLALLFLFTKTPFRLKLGKELHPKMGAALVMSLNLILRAVALNIALFLANRYATSYGAEYIDAQSFLFQIWILCAFILDGYSNAGNAIGGRLRGAGDYQRLVLLVKDLTYCMLWVGLALILFLSMGYRHLGPFLAPELEELHHLVEGALWIVILMQPLNAFAFLYDGVFKGLGEAAFLRNLLLVATFLGFIPTLFLLDSLGWKLQAIWWAFFVWMLIRAGGLFWAFRYKYAKKT